MKSPNRPDLTTAPLPKLIRMIAIPSSLGFLFNTLYNVVDTYFGGRISTDALAALSLTFPIFFIVIALGSGIATGTVALVSNALGGGNIKEARYLSSQAISFGFLASIALTFIGLYISPQLCRWLGASDDYLALTLSYSNVIFYGALFFMLNFILNAILNAQGDTKTYRNLLIIGFFLNIVLDPWFIYGGYGLPAMGLPGVAWSTLLIQLITTIALFYKTGQTEIYCLECFDMLRPKIHYYREIAKQGIPASLNMLTIALGIFVITYFISRFSQSAVAAYGIATRVDQLAVLPIIGLTTATLTLVGQNNGALQFERVKNAIILNLKYGMFTTTIGVIIVFFSVNQLMALFSKDAAVIAIGAQYLRISIFTYWAYTLLYISVSALQGLKKPLYAIWIGLYRQIFAPIIIFWLLAITFKLGLNGIWYGILTITWSAALVTLLYLRRILANRTFPDRVDEKLSSGRR